MRRLVLLIFGLCLLWPLAGCGSQKTKVEMPEKPTPKPTGPPTTTSTSGSADSTPANVPGKTPAKNP
jgi:hypothetical protein